MDVSANPSLRLLVRSEATRLRNTKFVRPLRLTLICSSTAHFCLTVLELVLSLSKCLYSDPLEIFGYGEKFPMFRFFLPPWRSTLTCLNSFRSLLLLLSAHLQLTAEPRMAEFVNPDYKGPINRNPSDGESGIVIYGYVPSAALAIVALVTFTIALGGHLWRTFQWKQTRAFHALFATGCVSLVSPSS